MSAPAAISGTFADFRTVKGRKVCQLVVEIPVEQADAALAALGGVPQPADPKWVAIARLDAKAIQTAPATPRVPSEPKERKRWDELPPAQQAAIRCGEPEFWNFLAALTGEPVRDAIAADKAIKRYFVIESKRELNDVDVPAMRDWRRVDDEYWAWQRDPRRNAA